MSNKKSVPILIGIIGLLLILLAGSIGYILGGNSSNAITEPSSISNDKKVLQEIEELKLMYDTKIADKTNTYKALQEEKERVKILVLELEKTKGDANSLIKYKTEYQNLESKMKILVDEIVVLKGKKSKVVSKTPKPKPTKEITNSTEITLPKTENVVPKKEIQVEAKKEVATVKQEDIFSKVATSKPEPVVTKTETPAQPKSSEKKYSKVSMSNVKAGAFISKSASKQEETTNASRADLLKITFTLDGNPNAKAGDKTYYFQIINGKNNVLGKRVTEFFENESLTYSFKKSFDYNNETTTITQEFLQDEFQKGVYFINIFDRDDLVGKTSFTLK
ncbi:hypothetical protein [Flavobacterium sp.]|uniref:hypothetical protein n=1 Tax=Flavobacterium sp. TaxID=239 RepID=UPI000ED6FF26|nr:hypothetical protein [Flavobacterium sp.]HCQ12387.1 hypothetical protein [Flavobacterium sp.]